jgi:hypothetical protein
MGHPSGMKLIIVKTGKAMALYAKVSFAKKKIGRMKFLPGKGYGDDFKIMAVMSLLAILEAERRYRERAAACSLTSSDDCYHLCSCCSVLLI